MGITQSSFLHPACNPCKEEQDDFFHNRKSRILSEQEYNKYFGKDKVETGIFDSDDGTESEEEHEFFRKMSIKQKERMVEINRKKKIIEKKKQIIIKNKIERIMLINQFDEDIY